LKGVGHPLKLHVADANARDAWSSASVPAKNARVSSYVSTSSVVCYPAPQDAARETYRPPDDPDACSARTT